jgi:DNA-binding NtrC family response regulator
MAAFLLADADGNHREALAIALRLDGHEVTAVRGAAEGRAALAGGRFDCCVVDVHLAGADELLDEAQVRGACAVATGPYPELVAAAAGRHPHAGLLPKPFRAQDLARVARVGT